MMKHESYMQRCISLAENAKGQTSPNPLVGAVVVYQDRIIGEGWHHFAGGPHAEVNAINSVEDPSLLSQSTIYVSLEPCAHFGKTPPCSDLIIEKKIPRVVIGCRDPFSEVNGRGIEKLRASGVEVIEGVLEEECRNLNAGFFTFHTKKRPYIILKWAQTTDGFMDPIRQNGDKGVKWITQPETKVLVHQWRAEVDAILVGKNTVLNDDPSLTVREVAGKNPIRLVMDPHMQIRGSYSIFNDEAKTFIFTGTQEFPKNNTLYQYIDFDLNPLHDILQFCYQHEIQTLMVEGGAKTIQSFIDGGLWDEARVLNGVSRFGAGLSAPRLNLPPSETTHFAKDTLNIYRQ